MEKQLKEMLDNIKNDNTYLADGMIAMEQERERIRVAEDIKLSTRLEELKAELANAKNEEERAEIRQKILVIKSTLFRIRNITYGIGM